MVLTGLNGKSYPYPALAADVQNRLDSNIAEARKALAKKADENNFVWLGRRLAYASHYREAINVFTDGLSKYPESVKLLRHRGHRYITMRMLDSAVADLSNAAFLLENNPMDRETEPDGIPNALGKPLSSTQFNVYYHLALAYYLQWDLEHARQTYLECMKWSDNDDLLVATADWLYMTLRRLKQDDEAKQFIDSLPKEFSIIENDSYLKRIQLYRNVLPIDSLIAADRSSGDYDLTIATQGYGAANWLLYNGDTAMAMQLMNQIISGKNFAAFGFIAAESDFIRLQKK